MSPQKTDDRSIQSVTAKGNSGSCYRFSHGSNYRALVEYLNPKRLGCLVSSKLSDLAQAHLAIIALLDSTITSPATRRQLEVFRDTLEREIAELRDKKAGEMAAD
jgi:hypothetical protein